MAQRQFSWDIFCTVIDNYGDIGIAWRLARQLVEEQGQRVRLWIDLLGVLHRFMPEIDPHAPRQFCHGVEVCQWGKHFPDTQPAEVVVESFACELPPNYVAAMAAQARKPVWVNLEYLSAEDWVDGCHGLGSPHPRLPLTKHFFFPGFTPRTGGLLWERDLLARQAAFSTEPAARAEFWRSWNLPLPHADEIRVSLFAYENRAVLSLLEAWSQGASPVTCLVPEGRILGEVRAFFGHSEVPLGSVLERGQLRLKVLPFTDQAAYDRLLWACDCNFVRGEDSFVRAQWAQRPFIWQIYPQDERAHWKKLDAFLGRYCAGLSTPAAAAQRTLWAAWNSGAEMGGAWQDFWACRAELEQHGQRWSARLQDLGSLATNLVQFCENKL